MDNSNLLNKTTEESKFDVFLCHNSLDKDEVKKIGLGLRELGILPWLDEWNLRPGFPWQKELEKQISSITSVAVFVGENNIGPWQDQEIDAFLRQFIKRKCPVIPVILPSCNQVPTLPIFLEGLTWVDFRVNEPNPLGQLLWSITGEKNYNFYNYNTTSDKGNFKKNVEQNQSSYVTNIYGPVFGQVHTGSGNIVFPDIKSVTSEIKEDLYRPPISNYHKQQLGQEYEKKLTGLNNQRITGDIDGAWNNIRIILEDLTVRDIPQKVAARFYYQAAVWAISDFPNSDDSERYYNNAINLNTELDTRTYQAIKLLNNGNFDEALDILKPYNNENVLSIALKILLEQGKGSKGKDLINQCNFKITHKLRHMLSLCYIQLKEYDSAKTEILKAIAEIPNVPIYHLIAGLTDYWNGVPNDIESSIYPVFINTKLFSPTDEQRKHLKEALLHFEQAKVYASFYNNMEITNLINQGWYLTAYLLPEKKEEADRLVISIIKNNPIDSVAILYAIENNLSIEESVFSLLKELITKGNYDYNHIIALTSLFLQKGEGIEAQKLLKQFKDEFLNHKAFETWILMMIDAYSITDDLENAKRLIDSFENIDDDFKDRLKCSIYEKFGYNIELKELLINLSERTGKRIDIRNLVMFYKKEQLWGEVIELSKRLIQNYSDIQAVEILAGAQLNVNRPNECLDILEKHKSLFPGQVLSTNAKMTQLKAYQALGKLDDALNCANELWKQTQNENLLLLRARLYFLIGDKNSTISVLKSGIADGFSSASIFLMLADLIKHERPNEAFDYANKAIEAINDNPQIYLSAINIGFHTGHDLEAGQLLVTFQSKFPDCDLLKSISPTEAIPIIQKLAEEANERQKYYLNGQMPLHILLDCENRQMGLDFYWKWQYNKDVDFRSKIPLLLSFGGRAETNVSMFKSDKIYMDYSACLVAHALELFENLKNGFSQIVISPFLLGHINMEIHNITEVQISRIEIRKKILSNINKLKIKYIPVPYVSDTKNFDIELSDFKEFIAAKENNALIVSDSFSTELLKGRNVPNEIKSLQVYICEVLQALAKIGEVEFSTIEKLANKKEIRDDIVGILINSTPTLLVDSVFIETMQDLDCLDIVAERFHLVAFEDIFDSFRNEQKALEKREETANWLIKLLDILNNLKTDHKLITGSSSYEIENDKMKLSGLLSDMLSYSKENEITTWCDDRNINSYSFCEKSPIVNVFDVIEWLYVNNKINQDTYRAKMNVLYSCGALFHVPSSIYLTMILGLTNEEDNSGLIKETSRMRIIRQYISATLSDESVISKQKLNHVYIPEYSGFLLSLHKSFENTLSSIWNNTSKNEKWRFATSTWMLLYCSDFIGDITHISGNSENIDSFIALKQSILISLGFRMTLVNLNNLETTTGYFNWLFTWLERNWEYNQDIKTMAFNHFIKIFIDVITKDLDPRISKDKRNIFLYIFDLFLEKLPENAKQWFLNHKEIVDILGDDYKKVITIEGLPQGILKDTWHKWVSNALNRGSNQKGTEFLDGQKINIIYQEGTITSQYLQVDWRDKDDKPFLVNVLEPFAQLYHPNAEIRCGWIGMASQYLDSSINLNDCLESLRDSKRFHDTIERLEYTFLKSPRYFYEKLAHDIKNNTNQLPMPEIMFPHDPDVFTNQLSTIPNKNDSTGEVWFNHCSEQIEKYGLENTLSITSTLPLGGIWSFTNLLNKLTENNALKEEMITNWCITNLENTFNPIKQQNIIGYLLQKQQKISQPQIDLINKCFIVLFEHNKEIDIELSKNIVYYHKLYILLLKTSWRYMESIRIYDKFDIEKKILWSYVYSDAVLQIFIDLISQNRVSFSVEALLKAFKNLSEHLISELHPLRERISYPLEVTHPESASVWRNIYGGTLSIIHDQYKIAEPIENVLKPILNEIEKKYLTKEVFNIEGGYEYLLSFNSTNNYFFSNLNKNNIKLIQIIQENWGDEISEKYDPIIFCKTILNTLLEKDIFDDYTLSHLLVLAYQPFPSELVDIVKSIIEKYHISDNLTDHQIIVQGKMLSTVIKGFQEKDSHYYRGKYKQDLKLILLNNPSRWKEVIEILISIYSSQDYILAVDDFNKALEEIVMDHHIEITPEFINFINEMPWWVPVRFLERVHKIRRWVNLK